MKRLKFLTIIMLFLASMTIFASCKDVGNYDLDFKQSNVSLIVGQIVDLTEIIELEGITIENVQFNCTNSSVVYIKPNKQMQALQKGAVVIEAVYQNIRSYTTVTVSAVVEEFSSVTNLAFNNATNKLTWNHAFKITNTKSIQAREYQLEITKNGQKQTISTVNNYYQFESAGSYSVSVIAKAEEFQNSQPQTVEFVVLPIPQNVTYDKETQMLSWNEVENATYIVFYDDFSTETSANSLQMSFIQEGEHEVFVRAKIDSNLSASSQKLTITRLTSPEVSITNGILTFDLSQAPLIEKYSIKIESSLGEVTVIDNVTGTYYLEGFLEGQYFLQVTAIAKGAYNLDSLNPQSYSVYKLSSPTLTFDKLSRKLFVSQINATLVIKNMVTNVEQIISLNQNTEYILPNETGIFKIGAYFAKTNDNQLKSDVSNEINVKILSAITQLRHVSTDNVSYIIFKEVVGAEGYKIRVDSNLQNASFEVNDNNITFALQSSTNEVFSQAKEYILSVEAYDLSFEGQGENYYLIRENEGIDSISITRLQSPTPIKNEMQIEWDIVLLASEYTISLEKNDEIIVAENTNSLSYDIQSLRFGNYKFGIISVGNSRDILSSILQNEINFSIKETLNAPLLEFDRTTQSLVLTGVLDAERYQVDFNGELFQILTESDEIYIGDLFNASGEYIFEAYSYSISNDAENGGNLYKSAKTSITIEKLPSISQVTLRNENELLVDLSSIDDEILDTQKYELLVNEQLQSSFGEFDISQLSEFTVKIKLIANRISTSPYYIDSAYSIFGFERFETPTSLAYSNDVISWQEVENASKYNLSLYDDEVKYDYEVLESEINLSSFSEEDFYEDLFLGFSFEVSINLNDIVVADGQSGKISSNTSEKYFVEILSSPEIESVTFDDDILQNQVTITWQEAINAEKYIVNIGQDDIEIEDLMYTFATDDVTFTVYAISSSHLSSQKTSLSFAYVQNPQNAQYDNDENLTVETYDNVLGVLFNGEEIENNTFSLSTIETTENVKIKFLGEKLVGNVFYLNSDEITFTFERLSIVENVEIINNSITWEIEPRAEQYQIKLLDVQNQEKIITLNAKNGNEYISSLSLLDEQVLTFTTEAGAFNVFVKAIVLGKILTFPTNSQGLLSANWSLQTEFMKLSSPTNLTLQAEDTYEQKIVYFAWDEVEFAEEYEIYINDAYFDKVFISLYQTDQLTYDKAQLTGGVFNIQIIAKAENCVSSNISPVKTIRRLPSINENSLYVSGNALFSWQGNAMASGYSGYFQKADNTRSVDFISTTIYHDFQTELTNDEFAGSIDFYVLALGDKFTTLSSAYVSNQKQRLDKPVIEVLGSSLSINASELNENAKFNLTIKFDDFVEVVILNQIVLNANEIYNFPDVWMYNSNEITMEGNYIFEAYAFCDGDITSATTTVTMQKLQTPVFDGFMKLSGEQQQIILKANVGELYHYDEVLYTLNVQNTTYENTIAVPNFNGELIYYISDAFDYYLNSGYFSITLKATLDGYLDSSKAIINGFRLNPISRLDGSDGVLNWQRNSQTGVNAYLLRILHGENVLDYLTISTEKTSDDLLGVSGNIVANIKAIGNLSVGTYQKDGVVLDSSFMLQNFTDNILIENNFTTTKLSSPETVLVVDGEFQISNIIGADNYFAKDNYDRIYGLQTKNHADGYVYGLSDEFYQGAKKLNLSTTYTFTIKAISNTQNVLQSDYSSGINIRILPNPNVEQDDLTYRWSTDQVNQIEILWEESQYSGNYQYELLFTESSGAISVEKNVTPYSYFTFNTDVYRQSGNYSFRIKVLGTSNLVNEDYYYLTSSYSPYLEFTKLSSPIVSVDEGKLVWEPVQNANAYYVYYMQKTSEQSVNLDDFISSYTEYPYMISDLYFNVPDSFGSLDESIDYYFAIRAINTNVLQKSAPSLVGPIFEYEVNNGEIELETTLRAISKLQSPNELMLQNGKLIWKEAGLDYSYNFDMSSMTIVLNGGQVPFVYKNDIESLANLEITISLIDVNLVQRKYVMNALMFFEAEVFGTPLFDLIAQSIGLDENYEFGWPTLSRFTNELDDTVMAGLQHISVNQLGNDYDWLNSMYTTGYQIYVPHRPITRISNYVLSWDPVDLPIETYIYGATNKYIVVAENDFGDRTIIYETNELSVDLRDLVNADILASGNQKLYVFVAGDNQTYVNGLASNPISVQVLPSVVGSITNGVLDWASISQTVTYNLIMDPNNTNYRYESTILSGPWDFSQISAFDALGQVLNYRLTMQAIGNGTTIISGKVTDLGTVLKLDTPQMQVVQGLLNWNNIEHNTGYNIIVKNEAGVQSIFKLTTNTNLYESKINGFNNYNIRTLGSTLGSLNASTLIYAISSKLENGVNAVMLSSITVAKAYQGDLVWSNIREINNTAVTGYKITFDDKNYYNPIFVSNFSPVLIDGVSLVEYKIDSSYLAGEYKIYIQPYSSNSFYRESDGKTYQYLLGGIIENQSTIEFIKLRNVSNIKAEDGVISWAQNDPLSNEYKLTFVRGAQKVEFRTSTNSFNPALLSYADEIKYKTLLVEQAYSIKIQTLGNDLDLINADEIESLGYSKLSTIETVEYIVDENGEEGFIIRWLFANYPTEITDYHYIIRFDNSNSGTYQVLDSRLDQSIRRGFNEVRGAYYGEIDGSSLMNENTVQLKFQIAIVPITTTYMLTSNFADERTVTPPNSLSSVFNYDASARKISWQYDSGGTDVSFRIIDEIVEIDEEFNVAVVQTRTYVSQVKEFYPELIGLHRISISVVLTGEQVASSYVYFTFNQAQDGIINNELFTIENNGDEHNYTILNFDLFESGDGNIETDTPYIISNQAHFENINQRLSKPSYLGAGQFTFKQTQNLTVNLSSPISAFAGVYDGRNYQISWQISNVNSTKVALFLTLESSGILKNMIVMSHIVQQEDLVVSTVYMSSLVAENFGTITDCQIKSFTFETNMTRGIDYYYGSFASINYGTITNSVNSANIVFDGGNSQLSVRNSKVYVGGIAYNNSKTTKGTETYIGVISQTGNLGNIKVVANSVSIGGIVASTNIDSYIEKSYNKGSIEVTLSSTASTANYIGGLVAYNQGMILNSYNVASSISANISNFNRTINIGGIAGYIAGENGAVINNCYTTTTNYVLTNASLANVQKALMVGFSNAQDTTIQIKSYYTSVAGMVAINNAPNGFTTGTISSYTNLLSQLNSADYVYAQGVIYPILIWENSFVIL